MDKEAQRIAKFHLAVGGWDKLSQATRDGYLARAGSIIQTLEELGYRKLPKDKPPLLGDRLIEIWERFDPEKPIPLLDMLQEIAKAQWNEWNKAIYGQSNLHIETQADRNDEIDRLAYYEKQRYEGKK